MKEQLKLFLKDFYLLLVKISSKRMIQTNEKIVFLLSFPETSSIILDELYKNFSDKLVICYINRGEKLAKEYQKKGCACYSIDSFKSLLKNVVPITKSSKVVLCDNYFAFLAGIDFLEETSVVQLWHANGAIKSFGLTAKYAQNASMTDKNRYKQVYKKYTHYVVSSRKMATIFEQNYQEKFKTLPFGYLLTDLYFDKNWLEQSEEKVRKIVGDSKKIVLYVPTYRETEKELPLNFEHLVHQIGGEFTFLVKAHPHDKLLQEQLKKEKQVISDFKGSSLPEILPFVDCLITDYSSVPFEYSLANPQGKMIFYCYDLAEYREEVGIESDFEQWIPGEIVTDEKSLVKEITNPINSGLDEFNEMWNEYVDGQAKKQLVEWVKEQYVK